MIKFIFWQIIVRMISHWISLKYNWVVGMVVGVTIKTTE